MRYIQAAESFPWMRIENTRKISRNWFNSPGSHWRVQTESDNTKSGRLYKKFETERPGNIRMGNSRSSHSRWHLRQIQRSIS
ncbi:hypothetical protein HUJ05_013028 [Dendroctonus ponderosae]|nr:hypothetical protein HUJ05_013028 [Dendroctonus ponderosae]